MPLFLMKGLMTVVLLAIAGVVGNFFGGVQGLALMMGIMMGVVLTYVMWLHLCASDKHTRALPCGCCSTN